jgi:hypothetical protein
MRESAVMSPRAFFLVFVFSLSLGLLAHVSWAGDAPPLKQRLLDMLERDQRHRNEASALEDRLGHESPEVQALWEKQVALDRQNLSELLAILESSGWPRRSEVGSDAAMAAFLVVQHGDLETQKRFLPALRLRVDEGEAQASHWALLLDRVRMREGLPQVYGSQVVWSEADSRLQLHPVEDPTRVDARRAEVGLPPLAEYLRQFGIEDVAPPGDEGTR